MRKRYLVRLVGNTLRLHTGDGWTEDLVRSMLSTGDIRMHGDFYHLSHADGISAFDEERLSDLCSNIQAYGKILSESERGTAIRFYSSVGVFQYGEAPPKRFV